MKPELLVFDLDDTLYSPESGLWHAIGDRINLFIQQRLDLPPVEASRLRDQLFNQYGTTLRGLEASFGIDAAEYLAFVHDVPLHQFLKPDPVLRQILSSLPFRKIIFTNGDRAHAGRVLSALNVADCFDGIIDVMDIAPFCKPMPESFHLAVKIAAVKDLSRCVIFEDSPRNLTAARSLGLFTVQVGKNGTSSPAHLQINTIHDLPAIFTDSFCIEVEEK